MDELITREEAIRLLRAKHWKLTVMLERLQRELNELLDDDGARRVIAQEIATVQAELEVARAAIEQDL